MLLNSQLAEWLISGPVLCFPWQLLHIRGLNVLRLLLHPAILGVGGGALLGQPTLPPCTVVMLLCCCQWGHPWVVELVDGTKGLPLHCKLISTYSSSDVALSWPHIPWHCGNVGLTPLTLSHMLGGGYDKIAVYSYYPEESFLHSHSCDVNRSSLFFRMSIQRNWWGRHESASERVIL